LRIIADDRLTGPAREKVQARLDLWLKTHVEKLLGPMFELAKAEDVTGIARGIAFQLIEQLGVIERARIAAEMKDLDQSSRATLRKYGVRFGAYHIYFPALLKPAARALASLLWAEKQNNIDPSVLSGAQHLASSGRTSFPVDKALPRDAYRVLGYKQCGERAVRVDILERLADLIRPALSWREASPGEKPTGAFDGRGFIVTQAMTSLTGSAGEDFAPILRALGYRMERRPPLPPKPVAATEPIVARTETAPAETVSETPVETLIADEMSTAVAVELIEVAASEAPSAALLPAVTFGPTASEPAASEDAAVEPAASEDLPVAVEVAPEPVVVAAPEQAPVSAEAAAADASPEVQETQEPAAPDTPAEPGAPEALAADAPAPTADSAVAPETAPEPQLIEVWRPGGRSEERRPRHDRNRPRHGGDRGQQNRPQRQGADAVVTSGEAAATPADGDRREQPRHGRRGDKFKDFRRPRDGAPAQAAVPVDGAAPREERGGRPRPSFEGKGRDNERPGGGDRPKQKGKFGGDRGGRDQGRDNKGGRDRRDGGPSLRPFASSASPRDRDRQVDPNSPFAKLAALKDQLAANRKD